MDNVTPLDREYFFQGNMLISQTDLKGTITYVNRKFCEVSGYKREELVGQNHSIVRHPGMPSGVFAKMWSSIADGQSWNGLIKNLRPDGLYYWVDTEIIPVHDEHEVLTGFISARKVASKKDIDENQDIYTKMLQAQ